LDVLLLGVLSPGGCVTLTVLTIDVVEPAAGWMVAVMVKVTVPPGLMVTDSLMLPLPLAWATLDPLEATAVQVSAVAMLVSVLSVTVWLVAVSGPALVTTTV